MDIDELYHLTKWSNDHVSPARELYRALGSVLRHNASQASQQDVSTPLTKLLSHLELMPLESLTNQQRSLFALFEIEELIGKRGKKFVREVIQVNDFDRATAASAIENAANRVTTTLEQLGEIESAFGNLPVIFGHDLESETNQIVLRVQFKQDASISNVANWKSWSREWYDIVRGIAMCVNEAPEDTAIIGATNGSIIKVLAASYPFAKLLALITKELSFITKEILQILDAIEDLRHKKILNREIEKSLQSEREKKEKEGLERVLKVAKEEVPDKLDGDQETNLRKAIEKLFKFQDKGGDIDFVEPETPSDEDEGAITEGLEELEAIRETIKEIRSAKEDIKLLTDGTKEDTE